MRQLRGEGDSGADAGAARGPGSPPDLSFQQEEPAELEGAYVAEVQELAVGDFDASLPRAYNRSFAAKAERQEGDTKGAAGRPWRAGAWVEGREGVAPPACPHKRSTSACGASRSCSCRSLRLCRSLHTPAPDRAPALCSGKMKALSKEVRGFSGRTRLPIYAASSILVRYDSGERRYTVPHTVPSSRYRPHMTWPRHPLSPAASGCPALEPAPASAPGLASAPIHPPPPTHPTTRDPATSPPPDRP